MDRNRLHTCRGFNRTAEQQNNLTSTHLNIRIELNKHDKTAKLKLPRPRLHLLKSPTPDETIIEQADTCNAGM